ncbi:MAG: ABC transporter ATP-binding protein [Desulfurococcales archaeon]|nr:ABC transporter ATP-binding protein [Desulfurococcales archaeon]
MAGCSLWGRGVWKLFGGRPVLRGADWEFRGRLTLLLAPNGSGKSTLLLTSLGVYKPTRGSAGVCLADRRELGVALEFRETPLYARVADFLLFTAGLRGLSCDRACVERAVELVGLPREALHQRLGSLSSGQLRLAMLAQALLGEPEVVVLDEPFANLDAGHRIRVSTILNRLSRSSRVVVATHVLAQLRADEAYTIREGRLRGIRPPEPRRPLLVSVETGEIVEADPERALELLDSGAYLPAE